MLSLDDVLEVYSVAHPGAHDDEHCPEGWYAVCDDDGHIAYFAHEKDACAFRLMLCNFALNARE